MTKVSAVALAALSAALLSGTALAGDGNSKVSVGYTAADFDDATLGLAVARYNYSFTDYLAAEGEIGFGIVDDDVSDSVFSADVSADFTYGLFGVVQYPFDDRGSNVFARIGYMDTDLEFDVDGFGDIDVGADGAAYGIGANYFFNEQSGVRFDYTRFDADVDEDGVEADGEADLYGISYVFKF